MADRNFRHLLEEAWREDRMVCVGLDPDWERIPPSLKTTPGGRERDPGDVLLDFNKAIIDVTYDVAGTYKPQSAYYEKFGASGYSILKATVEYMDARAPRTGRILDAKRADIDRTNRGYVDSIFGYLGFDAVTLHPYLGGEQALRPFLDQKDKGCIVLCRTSNPEAAEFQDLSVAIDESEVAGIMSGPVRSCEDDGALTNHYSGRNRHVPLYKLVALRVANYWNTNGNCLLVIGATYPREAQEVRRLVGDDVYFLVPGIGTQGGDITAAVKACRNSRGEGFIVNSSSGIIHASSGDDFAERARERAIELNNAINQYRKEGL